MGWCHEFGVHVDERCADPMDVDDRQCRCTECGAVCRGRFAGCAAVWERGPRDVRLLVRPNPRTGDDPVHDLPRAPSPSEDRVAAALSLLLAELEALRQTVTQHRAAVDATANDLATRLTVLGAGVSARLDQLSAAVRDGAALDAAGRDDADARPRYRKPPSAPGRWVGLLPRRGR